LVVIQDLKRRRGKEKPSCSLPGFVSFSLEVGGREFTPLVGWFPSFFVLPPYVLNTCFIYVGTNMDKLSREELIQLLAKETKGREVAEARAESLSKEKEALSKEKEEAEARAKSLSKEKEEAEARAESLSKEKEEAVRAKEREIRYEELVAYRRRKVPCRNYASPQFGWRGQ
jgi:hypothetical protein